ncbi:BQ00720 family protein [Xanthobacter pseudotagetidis]|uniref:BQ00720 family protein n=1 Tax=Xanthobacter pseudotagetidis TaxID=3119911 RepID=UPI003729AD81
MTNDKTEALTPDTIAPEAITPEALAGLGGGHIAYVRTIRSEDVASMFPQAPQIAPGMTLFTLHAADGTPILLTDSREAALANAIQNELETVSVH